MIELVRSRYADFGPTLATEVLLEKDGVKVSRETLRKWMVEDGLWLSRKQRRVFHQPRLRRESYGELIQIDGSEHRWFEDRGAPCSLLVFIDDATSSQIKILNGGFRLDVATTRSLPDLLASLECLHFFGTHGDLFFRWWDGWIYLCHCGA